MFTMIEVFQMSHFVAKSVNQIVVFEEAAGLEVVQSDPDYSVLVTASISAAHPRILGCNL